MPVGIDTSFFKPVPGVVREPRSILFLSRIAPSKRPELLIDALKLLKSGGVEFSASFYGSPLPQDAAYYEALKKSAAGLPVAFYSGVPNRETPAVYSRHEVFVNASPSGMYDKTLFEAAACGCAVLACSGDWRQFAGQQAWFGDAASLAQRLKATLGAHTAPVSIESHSLATLAERLAQELV